MLPCPAPTVGSARPPASSFPSQSAHCLPSSCISSHACVNSAPCSLSPSRPCVYWVSLGEALPSSIHRTELGAQTSCWQAKCRHRLLHSSDKRWRWTKLLIPKPPFLTGCLTTSWWNYPVRQSTGTVSTPHHLEGPKQVAIVHSREDPLVWHPPSPCPTSPPSPGQSQQ